MIELVHNFPQQLRKAKEIAQKAVLSEGNSISHVIVSGLGGSGIGGTIAAELFSENLNVPVIVNKDYFLPTFASKQTLVIISSYSGNTEETLRVLQDALKKSCQIVCITSGGKVLEIAKQNGLEYIEIPGGFPPRSCIGYSLVQLIKVFEAKGITSQNILEDVSDSATLLEEEHDSITSEAKGIAEKIANQITAIYALGANEGVAVRFRQQINENAKTLCWHHVFPEMNHNELVGWTHRNENISVVALRTSFDYSRTVKRFEICKPLFQKFSKDVFEVHAKGETKLQQYLYLIHIGDYISCYMADVRGVDPVEVNIIDHLKKELSKI